MAITLKQVESFIVALDKAGYVGDTWMFWPEARALARKHFKGQGSVIMWFAHVENHRKKGATATLLKLDRKNPRKNKHPLPEIPDAVGQWLTDCKVGSTRQAWIQSEEFFDMVRAFPQYHEGQLAGWAHVHAKFRENWKSQPETVSTSPSISIQELIEADINRYSGKPLGTF